MIEFTVIVLMMAVGLLGLVVWRFQLRFEDLEERIDDHYHVTNVGYSGPPEDFETVMKAYAEKAKTLKGPGPRVN